MKIITWNCNMAFRKKASAILAHKPDILIIVECEHPDKLLSFVAAPEPTDKLWFGKNVHKGLAIFSYGDYRFKVLECHNEKLKMIIPIQITGGHFDFNLFLIWAYNPDDLEGRYITQIWKAIHFYDELLTGQPTMFIGDFNSNTIWDYEKNRLGSHSAVVNLLQEKGIFSTYHTYYQQTQGTEQHPTFYLYRHKNRPYHLDYCFVSGDMLEKLQSVEIGEYDYWTKYSDHMPIIVTFNVNRVSQSQPG
ncbi:MAG: endonuclease/exonuclease/phosphatase family protein [Sphingobacteriales bacterium]|nr:MAG: endonuclease/exonuclease/phosphatase family protein [Sphingobacteriales bacterium]